MIVDGLKLHKALFQDFSDLNTVRIFCRIFLAFVKEVISESKPPNDHHDSKL